ncbi:3-hydroxy-3-methylglutaryl-CoA reductase [Candidatus Roizmanbacteria bacterium CG06_land_8_20_14_3_00_34_14]|uniref:hydroxymethylglutaryl-CoA reductase (NADPH) n=2 Tax=Candidatus Roizmaniibacteriota TaxID=1752723 RepID=A0A2M7ATX3_9BACT|nr:MAG: 3-hydroxy-3-methylglutaryl-CoA reductase [Candidatus Roizmanbacteria bacterium CG07_land_8_20_14_0_80_34_15]PIU74074.1 MAG: 3-hydroxy-3-methylglutaryl-CoA reductase [Candidatus Roizmanbacteria bacterium CG06_land_8_20_14_3_00_34_14]
MISKLNSTNKYMTLKDFKTTKERREYIEKTLKIKLEKIAQIETDEENIHCENLIGSTTLPLGVAGSLKIQNSEFKIQNYFIPLATTEGALVASVSRGCKAINLSGGSTSYVEEVGVTRGPVFVTSGLKESFEFKKWLDDNFNLLKVEAEKTSSHLKLKKLGTRIAGNYVYIRFYFATGNAMGMNMVTIATDSISRLVELETKVKCIALSGNFCIDKKPAWLNFISGRGKRVWSEVILKKEIVTDVLKTTPEKFFEVWLSKCMIGSAMSGSLGFNAHFANIVSAFYGATGQDLAHIVEGSIGMTITKVLENGDLSVSVYLPSVMLGTVGGGTKLKIKQEALSIIGAKNSVELAEVLGGAVLAGEISLLSSLAEGTLSCAHSKLGR